MAARSIASLTLSFGLVSIPVKLYSATESSATIRFNLLSKDGGRLKQQYVSEKDGKVVERADMVKGYEFEKDQFVIFTPEELKALDETASHVIEIVAFVPEKSVDPLYYDKAYLMAPDKRGGKPYALLGAAMRESGRCALARWTWKGKQYVVQVRAAEDGLLLQQLLYAEEVRSLKALDIEHVDVSQAELTLALQLIDQISKDAYDPEAYKDDEKKRLLAAIDDKISGKHVVASERHEASGGGQVIDLMEALRASLGPRRGKSAEPAAAAVAAEAVPAGALKDRKGVKRATKVAAAAEAEAPAPRARPRSQVIAPVADAPYTLRHIEQMLGLGRSVISSLIGAGFVTPVRGARNEYRFSFQDVVLLRTAHELHAARIPRRRLLQSLQLLKDKLPEALPLSGLRITAVGSEVVVREGTAQRDVVSGQLLLDFGVSPSAGTVAILQRMPAAAAPVAPDPTDWFARGEQLETQGEFKAAEQAYRRALAAQPDHGDAYLNLGAILCEDGRCRDAVALYDQAIANCPANALLHFNRAIALEDQHREREALASYERTLELAPDLADAHYNAARLHEQLGQAQGALRHFSAYRRLRP